jgi:hypothetical protein
VKAHRNFRFGLERAIVVRPFRPSRHLEDDLSSGASGLPAPYFIEGESLRVFRHRWRVRARARQTFKALRPHRHHRHLARQDAAQLRADGEAGRRQV